MTSWTKEAYEKSISSLCWSWTPYDDGWDNCLKWGGDIKNDTELQEIVGMEAELGEIPEWAKKIVTGPINCVAPCGHITFPRSYTDVLTAIGSSQCPPLNHTCYTLDSSHKLRMQDLALLLDGWLADAPNVADELQAICIAAGSEINIWVPGSQKTT